ncbi:MAG: hypothetical protein R3320_06640 [Nitriliruptorales bacterium]|nr:hypothetical protein [Nitriliruptorales bacterium]
MGTGFNREPGRHTSASGPGSGSVFVAVVAPEMADAEVPTPAGTGP